MSDRIESDYVFQQMSQETQATCWWCGQDAVGTKQDKDGVMRLTCGQKHGKVAR